MSTDSDLGNYITVAYDRYVSYYDVRRFSPRWVAYVADRARRAGGRGTDALFCVVIGRRNGTTAAVGFIMPHITTRYAYAQQAVPIDQIEQITGIDFMPLLGEPNPLEQPVDSSWLN